MITEDAVYVANLGDSWMVLGRKEDDGRSVVAEWLTNDHNVMVEELRKELMALYSDDSHIVVHTRGVWRIKEIIQGASGVGIGNFQEIGPLDTNLKPRNSTWLSIADLLFVDCPVGTGYSYVEDDNLLVKIDVEAANNMTTLLKELYNKNETLQKSPLFIVAESYGVKYAVTLGLSVLAAIKAGELKLTLGGIALGDTWISPVDFVLAWGPLLLDVSRLDSDCLDQSNRLAEQIRQEIDEGRYGDATNTWVDLEGVVSSNSNDVDFYNFLLDSAMDPLGATASESLQEVMVKRYSKYLSSKVSSGPDIDTLMNGIIREKLKIIPKNVSWGGQSGNVFTGLSNDFMKPRINEVDELLSMGVNVTIYSGQRKEGRKEGTNRFIGLVLEDELCC